MLASTKTRTATRSFNVDFKWDRDLLHDGELIDGAQKWIQARAGGPAATRESILDAIETFNGLDEMGQLSVTAPFVEGF